MKLLPYSNGVRKVSMKKEYTPKEIVKLIITIIGIILLVGFLYQRASNFIAKETLKQRVDYTTVDDKRMDYRLNGEGEYTVVFDGDIGGNLEQWTPVVEQLESDNIYTFVYNRRGYGYSDLGEEKTPEEQAQELKILLRKAGAPEPYILVGEKYGSIVLTSFAQQFKDSVSAVMLINPLDESYIGTKEYKKNQIFNKLRRKVEQIGSNFGLTTLLDKFNLDVELEEYEENLNEESLNEFKVQRTKSKYTKAVYYELNNLTKLTNNTDKGKVFSGMPYYLLTTDENTKVKELGDDTLTRVYITNNQNFLGLNDSENVVDGIRYILKELKKQS